MISMTTGLKVSFGGNGGFGGQTASLLPIYEQSYQVWWRSDVRYSRKLDHRQTHTQTDIMITIPLVFAEG